MGKEGKQIAEHVERHNERGAQGETSAKRGKKEQHTLGGGDCGCCDCDGSGRGWCADVSARMEAARRWRRRDASKDERRET